MSDERSLSEEMSLTWYAADVRVVLTERQIYAWVTRAAALEAEVARLREALRLIKASAVPFNIDREKQIVTFGEGGEQT
jgi:hypothetical protein